MELSARDLAFLEHEPTKIKEERDRDGKDRQHATSLLGRIEGEIEWKNELKQNGETNVNAGP
ncbi:hypothetical protein HUG10_17390 [Halorarum halophilum]|uniref:Uncharacterized protein n=1 Tax=Halorarum halophilum TaxID=2743090 RepID=A0A7D5K9L4_9EURY|nr:hypothetical protein [Halobaculum halophilum]QLG29194.1 hypothetical protein HUG10_17390 [Halobaculum halophilum]